MEHELERDKGANTKLSYSVWWGVCTLKPSFDKGQGKNRKWSGKSRKLHQRLIEYPELEGHTRIKSQNH